MAGELTGADVVIFTGGRLGDTIQVQNMLKAMLIVARRDAGWHVNPVRTAQVITMDGPDSRVLWIPTRKITSLTSIAEDGNLITPLADKVSCSMGDVPERGAPVRARKKGGGWWSAEYGSIVITLSHGYTDDEAADWRQGVLQGVDQMALVLANVDAGALTRKTVDDVTYGYQPYITLAEDQVYSMNSIFDAYRLPSMEFV